MLFPYFGAGHAHYFEHMSMMLAFQKKPSAALQKEIRACAPGPFKDSITFSSTYAVAGPDDYIHPQIVRHYDVDPGDSDTPGRPIFAADSRVRRFNEDIERWLKEVHQIAPLVAAVRPADGEAGGTEFNAWHQESLAHLDSLLERHQTTIEKARGRSKASTFLEMVLDLALESEVEIPAPFLVWLEPERAALHFMSAGDATGLRELLDGLQSYERAPTLNAAVEHLDLGDESVRRAVQSLEDELISSESGWATLVVAASFDGDDARVAELERRSPRKCPLADAFSYPGRAQPLLAARVLERGALITGERRLLIRYLAAASETKQALHPELIARALENLDELNILLNLTMWCYMCEDWSLGVDAVERAKAAGVLEGGAHLNAALIYLGAGDASAARQSAEAARDADDPAWEMIEPGALVVEGELDDALAALTERKSRVRGFRAWREDVIYAPLFEREDYAALFQ